MAVTNSPDLPTKVLYDLLLKAIPSLPKNAKSLTLEIGLDRIPEVTVTYPLGPVEAGIDTVETFKLIPTNCRCNICGGLVAYDGTKPTCNYGPGGKQ